MTIREQIEHERERTAKAIAAYEQLCTFALDHEEALTSLGGDIEINKFNQSIDFNWPTHAQTVEIIKLFPGTWEKAYNNSTINYTMKVSGITLRIYGGEPPPNCRVVAEEVLVPEQIIPATTKTVYKIVCDQ